MEYQRTAGRFGKRVLEMLSQVKSYMKRYRMVEPGEKVLVAVSGGQDSVALLHLLVNLAKEMDFSLHAAHLNHMFRGREGEEDAIFVRELAEKYSLPVTLEAVDVPAYCRETGLSSQAAAREIRYRFLQSVAQEKSAGKIALAHHADDQAETILINFLRGAGTGGMKGILPVREGLYIRPLLSQRRWQIEDYCRLQGLSFRTDSTNLKTIYQRNRIRLTLLPQLAEEYNPEIVQALLRQSEICQEEDHYLEEQARSAYLRVKTELPEGGVGLTLATLRLLPIALARRVLRLAWRDLTGSERDLTFAHSEKVLSLTAGTGQAQIVLPGGRVAERTSHSLNLHPEPRKTEVDFYSYPMEIPGNTDIPEAKCVIKATLLYGDEIPAPVSLPPYEALVNPSELSYPIVARQRLAGDLFQPYGQQQPQKLKNFLINQKIPREQRDAIPLICTPDEIIWVAGLRVGEKWKIDRNTKKALHLQVLPSLDGSGNQ